MVFDGSSSSDEEAANNKDQDEMVDAQSFTTGSSTKGTTATKAASKMTKQRRPLI